MRSTEHTLLLTLLLIVLGGSLWATGKAPLTVMTYNLRTANENPGEAWSTRRQLLTHCVQNIAPDIMGTQEGLYFQLRDIAKDLPELDWIGLGRMGGSRDEFAAIFFCKARLEPLEYDHFWLSDTPEVIGSSSWGNVIRRMVTWVRFRDLQTKQEFYVLNTHFDHEVPKARLKSAQLIQERSKRLDARLPLLLLGDFNAEAERSEVYKQLSRAGFRDAWLAASKRRGGAFGTFNGFGQFPDGFRRIDWILARGDVTIDSVEVVETAIDGHYPSDHFPVVAKLELTESDRDL